MPPEEQISAIREALNQIFSLIESRQEPLSEDLKVELAELINLATQRILEIQDVPEDVPEDAQLMWILAGGDRNIFMQYLMTFPSEESRQLLVNLPRLQQVIIWLERNMPQGERDAISEGTEESQIPSSNVWGFAYDPKSNKLRIKFNGKNDRDAGPVYEYANVPERIFELFSLGAIPAKTTGRNQWGAWWRGKQPSVGASMHQLIKLGGFPYQKVS